MRLHYDWTIIETLEVCPMNMKKWISLALAVCLALSLCACSADKNAVFVQSVKTLSGIGAIAPGDRFPGMVISENVTEIQKDENKVIAEVLVRKATTWRRARSCSPTTWTSCSCLWIS